MTNCNTLTVNDANIANTLNNAMAGSTRNNTQGARENRFKNGVHAAEFAS